MSYDIRLVASDRSLDHISCKWCSQIMTDPRKCPQWGIGMCTNCITFNTKCVQCDYATQQFEIDQELQQEFRDLQVYCSNRDAGWSAKIYLRNVTEHLSRWKYQISSEKPEQNGSTQTPSLEEQFKALQAQIASRDQLIQSMQENHNKQISELQNNVNRLETENRWKDIKIQKLLSNIEAALGVVAEYENQLI